MRIKGLHRCAILQQRTDQLDRWRAAQRAGAGFVGEAENTDRPAREWLQRAGKLPIGPLAVQAIALGDAGDDRERETVVCRKPAKELDIAREGAFSKGLAETQIADTTEAGVGLQ